MKNILKSLLALSLVFSLGLSAAEDKTGKPVVQPSTAKVLVAYAAMGGAMGMANFVVNRVTMEYWKKPSNLQYMTQLMLLAASNVGIVELSSHLMNKMGIKNVKQYLYANAFGTAIASWQLLEPLD